MATALFPVVDLRALSQSDLAALAAASSPHAVYPRRHPDSDVLPPSKIDRAIFNESAGSRKQTFSRLRHSSSPSSDLATSSSATPAEDNSENHLIVSHLRRLFAGEDPSFPAPPPPQPLTPAAPPEPSLPPPPPRPPPPDPDREAMNPKGVFLDLARLAELVDPYGEELRRRTAGLGPESELLGFMNGLEGQWGSRRRRRKFVDAAAFGDHLPRGWKLLLGLKRKEGVAWINCRRYVSPKGHQFVTCKEVSSYLMSLLGYPEAKTAAVENSLAGLHDLSADDQIGSTEEKQSALPIKQIGSTEEKQNVLPITSATLSGQTGDSEKQRSLRKDEGRVATNAQECQKCNLTFCDQSAYVQHQLSFHQKSAKRRRVGKPGEPVVRKDGKFESQERGRTSDERSDHFGHVGAHVTHQEPSSATSFHKASPGKAGSQSSLAALPCGLQEMTDSPEHTKERTAGEPNSGHQSDSSKVLEFASTNSKNFNRPDETCCRPEEVVPTSDAPSTTKYTNTVSPNVHQSDSSKVLEVSSTNSKNVNRPDKTCCRPEEVVPTTDAPSTSKYTNDPMNCADVTELKQVPQSSDLLDGKFNCFAEVTGFNDPAEIHLLSATLEVPNPKSVDLEVDDGNVTCKYGEVAKCTSFENDYTDEDQIIDCDMAASNDEINNDVKIQDVNLNSCLDISSPIDGANYELSNSPDDGNQSSIADKCFGASFNDDNACKAESFVNQNSAGKAETFVNQNSAMVYQSNLRMEPIYPRQINVDGFPSCSITSEITNNVQEREDNVKEQLGNTHNISSNEAGFDVEAYNSDIFGGAIAESNLAQLNNTISDLKADFSSCYSLSDLNTLTHGTAAEEIDVNCMRGSFVNGSVGRNGPNEHCTLDFDIKGSMLEAMKKSDNELENQYNGGAPGCDSLATAGTSGNINELMSMQVNFGSLSSLVRSVADVPMGSMIQDQCDLQLGFGGQKQMFPGFEDLRLASAGSSQFGSMTRHNSVPVPEPTLMLGYAPQLGSCPQVQLGWDLGLPKMVSGCMLTSVCVWCNNQFHHFGNVAEQQADSVGFICPACKEKISGHLSMLNNGSSL